LYCVPLFSAGLKLVKPREDGSRLVVSARQTDRPAPDDLVALAQQLTSARELVKERACDRLRGIAEQMEHLQKAAIKVLEEAKRDEELHRVACNMQKQPGRIYHLYRRGDGSSYFSLLAPEEWAKEEKLKEYVASYRLEMDRSWTPMADVAKRDRSMVQRETIILDNGGYTLKIGTSRDIEPRIIPNCIAKAKADRKREFIADEQSECVDKTGEPANLQEQRCMMNPSIFGIR
ncbi:hypothetical protein ANCDUO_16862, partial [Ancylostoma duodenale]